MLTHSHTHRHTQTITVLSHTRYATRLHSICIFVAKLVTSIQCAVYVLKTKATQEKKNPNKTQNIRNVCGNFVVKTLYKK